MFLKILFRVDKKVKFLDKNQENTQRMTGNAWYLRQTVRALTQVWIPKINSLMI